MKATCTLCFHHCQLDDGQTGYCRARGNRGGAVVPLNYGKVSGIALDPIEKKPLRRLILEKKPTPMRATQLRAWLTA